MDRAETFVLACLTIVMTLTLVVTALGVYVLLT